MRYLVIGINHRRGKRRVNHQALARPDLNAAPAARIGGDEIVRIDSSLQAAKNARRSDGQRRVHWPLYLRIRAGKIHDQLVGYLLYRKANAKPRVLAGRVVRNTVAITVIFEISLSVRKIQERRAHEPLRIIHDLFHIADQSCTAVALGELFQAFDGSQRCRELRAKIALAFIRSADVRQNELLYINIERAAANEPKRRHAQPFAEDLGDRAVTARRGGT